MEDVAGGHAGKRRLGSQEAGPLGRKAKMDQIQVGSQNRHHQVITQQITSQHPKESSDEDGEQT